MKSKGFSIPVDGRMKDFPAGADVPPDIVKEFGLVRKGLVERAPKGSSGPTSGARKSPNKTAK